jgi:hypothetical protein
MWVLYNEVTLLNGLVTLSQHSEIEFDLSPADPDIDSDAESDPKYDADSELVSTLSSL